jgi:Domain of unknown function (DUF4148)
MQKAGVQANRKENAMKLLSVLVAAALISPATVSFAQSQPITRTQVKAQLAELEKAGYVPGNERPTYPEDLQAAEAKVAAQHAAISDNTSAKTGTPAATYAGSSGNPSR